MAEEPRTMGVKEKGAGSSLMVIVALAVVALIAVFSVFSMSRSEGPAEQVAGAVEGVAGSAAER